MSDVQVDTNDMGSNNTIVVSLRRINKALAAGDKVLAADIATGSVMPGTVIEVREKSVVLRLDWQDGDGPDAEG